MLLAWWIVLQLSDIMVARFIILLSLTWEGAIDTTMQSEKRMASPNTSRGDARSNPPTNLADFSDRQANVALHQKTEQPQNSASGLIRCIARKPQWCRPQPPSLKFFFVESGARGLMQWVITVRVQAHSNIWYNLICSVPLSFVMLRQNRVFSNICVVYPVHLKITKFYLNAV